MKTTLRSTGGRLLVPIMYRLSPLQPMPPLDERMRRGRRDLLGKTDWDSI